MNGRLYTPDEREFILANRGKIPTTEIAEQLGRPVHSVYQWLNRNGLAGTQRPRGERERIDQRIRELHSQGWLDSEIADDITAGIAQVDRRTVCDFRRAMGLSSNKGSQRHRAQVAAKTREQLERKGLNSLAEERVSAFRKFAIDEGWPEDLRPRAVQILNALYDFGPQTRRQLAERIGMPWKGSRKSLVSNDPEGSYLAHLMKRGLVVALKRVVTSRGRGKSVNLYAIAAGVVRCRSQEKEREIALSQQEARSRSESATSTG